MADLETLSPTELFKLPPSVLDSLPALSPPPGVESNFVNPEDRGYILKSVATVLFCFMVCFFANRVYTKLFIIRKLGWDDCKCASQPAVQIYTRLTIVQSIVHNWICRFPWLSLDSATDGVTARFDWNVHRDSLE